MSSSSERFSKWWSRSSRRRGRYRALALARSVCIHLFLSLHRNMIKRIILSLFSSFARAHGLIQYILELIFGIWLILFNIYFCPFSGWLCARVCMRFKHISPISIESVLLGDLMHWNLAHRAMWWANEIRQKEQKKKTGKTIQKSLIILSLENFEILCEHVH